MKLCSSDLLGKKIPHLKSSDIFHGVIKKRAGFDSQAASRKYVSGVYNHAQNY